MRLGNTLLFCCFLLMFIASSVGKCRKKKGGKKCEKVVKGPPSWRRYSKETLFVERELSTVVFKCQARGKPRPRYKWYRDGKLLNSQKSKKYRRKRYRLTITALQISDTGNYTCDVYNTFGSLNRTFTLKVLSYKPVMSEITIKERPRNQTAQIGDSVVFRCSTDTFPKPTIEWSRKKEDSPRVDILQKPSDRTRAEMFLLDQVSRDDAGLYTCTIKNKISTRQLTAKLVVIGEGEELPFEPKCALHVRKQILFDRVYGCHTREPIKMAYCMGSCGRSYFLPNLVAAPTNTSSIASSTSYMNQTCQCCIGLVKGIHVMSLDCPSGDSVNAFVTTLRGCTCRNCQVEDEMAKSTVYTTRAP